MKLAHYGQSCCLAKAAMGFVQSARTVGISLMAENPRKTPYIFFLKDDWISALLNARKNRCCQGSKPKGMIGLRFGRHINDSN